MDSMVLNRIAFGLSSELNPTVKGNSEKNTLSYYKACVDYAVEKNAWLVFMVHVSAQTLEEDKILADLIDYIKSINVKILTAREGYEIHGNRYFSGDVATNSYTIVNKDNKIISSNPVSLKLPIDSKIPSTLISEYDKNSITYMEVSNNFASTHSLPTGLGGYLVTYKLKDTTTSYNRQEYWAYSGTKKFVRPLTSGGAWGAWDEVVMLSDFANQSQISISGNTNPYSASTPIADFPTRKVTIFRVNNSGATGFPNNLGGTVTTYKTGTNGYDYQVYKQYITTEMYTRTTLGDGTWGEWKKVQMI